MKELKIRLRNIWRAYKWEVWGRQVLNLKWEAKELWREIKGISDYLSWRNQMLKVNRNLPDTLKPFYLF